MAQYVILLPDYESPEDLLRTVFLPGAPGSFRRLRHAKAAVRKAWGGDGNGRINVLVETGLGWDVQVPAYDYPEGRPWVSLTIPTPDYKKALTYAEQVLGASGGWLQVIGETGGLASKAGKPLKASRKRW